jgi:hypothetical protein
LAYLAWPFLSGERGAVPNVGRQFAAVVYLVVSIFGIWRARPRFLLYIVAIANGIVGAAAGVALCVGAVMGALGWVRDDAPAVIYFLVFIPIATAVIILSSLRASRSAT